MGEPEPEEEGQQPPELTPGPQPDYGEHVEERNLQAILGIKPKARFVATGNTTGAAPSLDQIPGSSSATVTQVASAAVLGRLLWTASGTSPDITAAYLQAPVSEYLLAAGAGDRLRSAELARRLRKERRRQVADRWGTVLRRINSETRIHDINVASVWYFLLKLPEDHPRRHNLCGSDPEEEEELHEVREEEEAVERAESRCYRACSPLCRLTGRCLRAALDTPERRRTCLRILFNIFKHIIRTGRYSTYAAAAAFTYQNSGVIADYGTRLLQ